MAPVKMHKAKTEFSKLIARVEKGEEIVIARGDKPVAKIVPLAEPLPAAREKLPVATAFGCMKGQIWMADDAFDPLTEEELALWEDGPIEPSA
jgi:prevent-host-death family protein